MSTNTKKRKRTTSTCLKLPYVPRIVFKDKIEPFSTLTRSILESNQFEKAMNEGAEKLKRKFSKELIPEIVYVVESNIVDTEHKLGQYDPEFQDDTHSRDDYCILISSKLMTYAMNHQQNRELILLICITVVHEVSHILVRQGLRLPETPEKFYFENSVNDFGFFIERALFKELKLGVFGLKLFSSQQGWFDNYGDYSDALLGTDELGKVERNLSKAFINSVVGNKKWRAVKRSEVEHLDFQGRCEVCRDMSGYGNMRNVRGKCGTV